MIVDANVSLGYWPFQRFRENTPKKLSEHLKSEGISLALVSSLETVFYPDPDWGNKNLLFSLRSYSNLKPVMVLNPCLSDWRELLEKYNNLYKIKAIKILPSYHNYSLSSSKVNNLMNELAKREMFLIIQMRLEDERNQYPLLKIGKPHLTPAKSTEEIINLSKGYPKIPILVLCPYFQEAVFLVKNSPNIYIDTSFVESLNTLQILLRKISVKRVLFGSHTPFLYTRSNIMKIKTAEISKEDLKAVIFGNIFRLNHFTFEA